MSGSPGWKPQPTTKGPPDRTPRLEGPGTLFVLLYTGRLLSCSKKGFIRAEPDGCGEPECVTVKPMVETSPVITDGCSRFQLVLSQTNSGVQISCQLGTPTRSPPKSCSQDLSRICCVGGLCSGAGDALEFKAPS